MVWAEALDRSDTEQAAVCPEAVQGDHGIQQPVHVEREAVLRRGLREREPAVLVQERPDVRLLRVVHSDLTVSNHPSNVRGRYFSAVNPSYVSVSLEKGA